MGHSAVQFFRHWPELLEEYERISMSNAWLETFKHSGERMIPPMRVSDRLRRAGMDPNTPPGTFQMRPLVYKMFVRQVEKLGVDIHFGTKVVDYCEDATREKAIAITDQGERFEADVVIAADGVGSKSQKLVGGQVRARSSGRAMWRAAFSSEHLDKNPKVKEFFGRMAGESNDEPIVRTFLG
jgi:2-polyprenyl-6-methoxyphenol hydroxylase-like FAD-dependent oxidoreductase